MRLTSQTDGRSPEVFELSQKTLILPERPYTTYKPTSKPRCSVFSVSVKGQHDVTASDDFESISADINFRKDVLCVVWSCKNMYICRSTHPNTHCNCIHLQHTTLTSTPVRSILLFFFLVRGLHLLLSAGTAAAD